MLRRLRRLLLARRTREAGRQRQAWGAMLAQGQETCDDGDW
jgi:hypothetical protein